MGTLLLPRRISGQIECFLPTSHSTVLATHAQPSTPKLLTPDCRCLLQ